MPKAYVQQNVLLLLCHLPCHTMRIIYRRQCTAFTALVSVNQRSAGGDQIPSGWSLERALEGWHEYRIPPSSLPVTQASQNVLEGVTDILTCRDKEGGFTLPLHRIQARRTLSPRCDPGSWLLTLAPTALVALALALDPARQVSHWSLSRTRGPALTDCFP